MAATVKKLIPVERLRAYAAALRTPDGFMMLVEDGSVGFDIADALESIASPPEPVLTRAEAGEHVRAALKLAKQATNGWACYAKRKIEHDDIARLHREIDAMAALFSEGGQS